MKEQEFDIWSIELLDMAEEVKSDLAIKILGKEFQLKRQMMKVLRAYRHPTDLITCLTLCLLRLGKSGEEIEDFLTKCTEEGTEVELTFENPDGKPLRFDPEEQPAVAAMMNSASRTEINKQD
ncbi:MAG: hypothetical protein K6A67_05070 [Bacteroidales bacterium]|nr:hypothetical protein [Bacteroidales bacterium]